MTTLDDQITTVAQRLRDPETVVAAVAGAEVASLTHGLAGTALLHARLAHIDPDFAHAAHRHWTAAAELLKNHPGGFSGIQGGLGGLAASLIIGTSYLPDTHHHPATAPGATWLSTCASDMADLYQRTDILTWDVYDAITGLAGIGRVLLAAHHTAVGNVEPGLKAALTTLTAILAPRDTHRPGWWMPAADHPEAVAVHPSGAATTGLAHGVAGPLAFLSTAHIAGWSVPGQTDAIDHAATWLVRWRRDDGTWPPAVTGDELDNHTPPATTGRADAWCYGTPGITRALILAGHALGEPEVLLIAGNALHDFADRSPEQWDVDGPTLCHGYAGIVQSQPAKDPVTKAAVNEVAAAFDPESPFGFQHHDHGQTHDQPGLLVGAAGVALALADYRQLPAPSTPAPWDCLLHLS
ncbi:lanthionine synthetase C family protein [Stackebrandtia nassauensis]|uniref:Lanthionine synthetase C family protein n=1 Tax=Stackebrandtia nassauensis (strain DSM 44728 / CIP 108903 / NRRL B-16338 / NBRC 102104 / LLR-40K-21) TaxID=446470 RepID=D3PWP1_STANL|nr:lanthionine synthetase C family protein [Stackebrandtia nassauensis]ADD43263.1 Lanthionine synthetase C family protein [Stackebrandtia nassauensis DSM 44728]